MCCIFTCCGWMIDLVQRLWVFLMSCCMCSAVCMSVMTASMSGIAMGYNYSLAEYIEMKETNVSVYLKRGIFDDDLGEEMGFRRAAHMPISGLIKESNLVTGEPEEVVVSPKSGRRLDDSVLQSNDNSNFEGSLMKLTAKPPASTEPPSTFLGDVELATVITKFPADSLEQLKAIQSLMNMRKSNIRRITIDYDKTTQFDRKKNELLLGRRMMADPGSEGNQQVYIDKAAIPIEHFNFKENPVRTAVPSSMIGHPANWFLPKNLERTLGRTMYSTEDYDNVPYTTHTYPQPIRYKTGVERPTPPPTSEVHRSTQMLGRNEISKDNMGGRRFENMEMQRDKLLMDKAMFPSFKKLESGKSDDQGGKSEELDYEEEARRGIRVRKKRNVNIHTKGVIIKETLYTLPSIMFNKYLKVEKDRKPRNKTEQAKGNYSKETNYSKPDLKNTNENMNDIPQRMNTTQTNVAMAHIGDGINGLINLAANNRTEKTSNAKIHFNQSSSITEKAKADKFLLSFIRSMIS